MSELEHLYEILAFVQARIDEQVLGGTDDVTWKGISQYEQRCHRCGFWINTGKRVAAVRLVSPPGTILTRYIHEECIWTATSLPSS